MLAPLEVQDLGRRSYAEIHDLQQERVRMRIEGVVPDTLYLVEHDPVVTLGRGTDLGAAHAVQVPVVEVERGGEATYHGPGQLVAYPIRKLGEGERDLHAYLRRLEEVLIQVLADFGVEGGRVEGKTGVWIGAQKVASIGVAVRRWVTWHGIALNVSTDLGAFQPFRPCGLDSTVMTRLSDHGDGAQDLAAVGKSFQGHFAREFSYSVNGTE